MTSTVSVFRGSGGGFVGDGHVHPAVVDAARQAASEARAAGEVTDSYVARCGRDVVLVLLHNNDVDDPTVAAVAHRAFAASAEAGRRLGQHLAPDSECDAFVRSVEMVLDRDTPMVCFLAAGAASGCFNIHLYRTFTDPFTTPGLLDDPEMAAGFTFDLRESKSFDLPDDMYSLLASLREESQIMRVTSRSSGRVAAVASFGSDPIALVACHNGLPRVEDVVEPFATPYAPGSRVVLAPVSTNDDAGARTLGRVIGLGFQVSSGRLVGPRDLLGDRCFDEARRAALQATDRLRAHGPFGASVWSGGSAAIHSTAH